MKKELLKKAVILGQRLGHVFISTADAKSLPHLTVAARINLTPGGKLTVSSWFCPGTVANLKVNPYVGVIVWDRDTDMGYQILGKSEKVKELAMLDGFVPKIEKKMHLPQVERELVIDVRKVLVFKQVPHSDLEEP